MEHRQAKTDEFFTKITSFPHKVFGGESGLSFLKERSPRADTNLRPRAFVQRNDTFQASNTAKWKRINRVVAGRIREIRLPWREFLLLSLDGNYEIFAKMIQITLLKVTGNVPGQPLLQQQIGAGQVQPLVQPGTIPWINRIDFLRNHVKGGFMRTHVGFPGDVQLVEGPDGEQQVIELPPVMGASSGEFLDIHEELDDSLVIDIFGLLSNFEGVCLYVWITFWLELTGQDCGPSTDLVAEFRKKQSDGIPGTFGTFALMNQKGKQWDLLHKFLVKFEERNPKVCLPGRIDSQEMNTFRDFLNGSEGGKDVIVQLIDFATEVIKLFNAKWKRLAEALPAFWYSAFYVRENKILPGDLRPFYEMFLMFSKAAPRDILVQVINKSGGVLPLQYNTVWTVDGTTKYRLVLPDANDPENLLDENLDDLVLRAVEDDHMREEYSENVEPDILVEDAFWDIKPANIPAGPGAGFLTFFKKPKIQKVHLFGPRESGPRCCRMRLSNVFEVNDKERTDPDTQLPNNQKFPSQVIMERSAWTNNARENTLAILKALSAAYPTYTQVVNVTNKGFRTDQSVFAPKGFIYKQVLFLFKVNGKEPHNPYESNTPIKILPDIWLEGNATDRIADYIYKWKEYPGSSFTVKLNIDQKVFTDTMRSLVKELDTEKIVWI